MIFIIFYNDIYVHAFVGSDKDILLDCKIFNCCFNLHTREKTAKLKLADTYELVMGKKNEYGVHRAKPDVKMVIDILRKLNYRLHTQVP